MELGPTEQYLLELTKVRCKVCRKVLYMTDIAPTEFHLCKSCEKIKKPGFITMLVETKSIFIGS